MAVPPGMVILSPSSKRLLIKALENGAMDFIMKPIDHMELRNKCVRFFWIGSAMGEGRQI
jgi:PleD family two-component response regulator